MAEAEVENIGMISAENGASIVITLINQTQVNDLENDEKDLSLYQSIY